MKPILKPGRNCWCVEPVGQAGLLIDGRDYFRAFCNAARKAQRYILITGWQFDSDARLLVGKDGDARFLPFLNQLCRENRDLRVYLLAWDFTPIFTFKREFLQSFVFNWKTEDNFHFLFDNAFPVGASHHHKFAVIDGWIAFAGGLDFCQGRWDVPEHTPENPHRMDDEGEPFNPHHDIQGCVIGPAAQRLSEVFARRWKRACGEALNLPDSVKTDVTISFSTPVAATKVAISRTQPRLLSPPVEPVQEIRQLYIDAIAAAEKLIYIENQYFSSQAIYKAVLERLQKKGRQGLQIVLVLPKHNLGWLEEVSMGVTQAKMLKSLQHAAEPTKHSFGVYYSCRGGKQGDQHSVYIHSKLMIVDDRFLTVGSANTNNRSMGLDTELNFSWEATSSKQRKLIRSIRQTRFALLAEHTGKNKTVQRSQKLVALLEKVAAAEKSRLCRHPMISLFEENEWLNHLCPDDLNLDPEKPIVEETFYETISSAPDSLLARGIAGLSRWLSR